MRRKTPLACFFLFVLLTGAVLAGPLDSGNALYKAGSYQEAATAYQQATQQTQGVEQAKAYYMLGNAYHKLGQPAQARDAYQQAQKIDPSLSFASSPQKFQDALARVSGSSSAPAPNSGGVGAAAPTFAIIAKSLATDNVYVDPRLPNIDKSRLEQVAEQSQDNPHTYAKIVMLASMPLDFVKGSKRATRYTLGMALHKIAEMGKNPLVIVILSNDGHQGASVITDGKDHYEYTDKANAAYYDKILNNPTEGTVSLTQTAISGINNKEYRGGGASMLWIVFLIIVVPIAALVFFVSKRKKQQVSDARGNVEALRGNVLSGIEYLDGYMDVLPKNNPDSDQVRAFRQSAEGKFEQGIKILDRATEVTDIQRAQGLLQGAQADVGQARRYLDRATGGTGKIPGDDAVRPQPLPETEQAVQAIPQSQRGVSFFSSQPAPLGSLVPVTVTINGQSKQVLATPEEADELRQGRMPQMRSFNVGGQNVPWYAYNNYDPYRDYWRYQNSGWGGFGGGIVAGLVGAELLGDVFSPHYYGGWGGGYGGGFGPGYAFDTGNDYYQGYSDAQQSDRAAGYGFDNTQTYDNAGGASFLTDSGPGYDQQGYGGQDYSSNAGNYGGGDRS